MPRTRKKDLQAPTFVLKGPPPYALKAKRTKTARQDGPIIFKTVSKDT